MLLVVSAVISIVFFVLCRPDTLLRVWWLGPSVRKAQPSSTTNGRKRLAVVVTGSGSGIGRAAAFALSMLCPPHLPGDASGTVDNDSGILVLATLRCGTEELDDSGGADMSGSENIVFVPNVDVSDPKSIAHGASIIAAKLEEHDALLYGVVSNAGIVLTCPVAEMQPEHLREVLETNVIGAIGVVTALLPLLRAGQRECPAIVPRVMYTSSVLGTFSLPLMGAYAASKHALHALASAQRVELAVSDGIKVALLEPSNVRTKFCHQNAERLDARLESEGEGIRAGPHDLSARAFADIGSKLGARDTSMTTNAITHAMTCPPRDVRARYPVGPEVLLLPVVEALLPALLIDCIHRFVLWSGAKLYVYLNSDKYKKQ